MPLAGRFIAIAAALALFGAVGEARAAAARMALVIGEGAYKTAPALANPPNDARDIGQELRALGFDVTVRVDLTQAEMTQAIADFGARAQGAELLLFYYGGHGVQLQQQNYLIPVDAGLGKVEDLSAGGVPLSTVVEAMGRAKGRRLIFIDACRENPLKRDEIVPGLARFEAPANFLIASATLSNAVAFDGAGRNSPFAQALLNNLARKGVDLLNVMTNVIHDVHVATGTGQTPQVESSLTRPVFLGGEGPADESSEAALWRLAASPRDEDLLRNYLKKYPRGAHASDAEALLQNAAPAAPEKLTETDEEEIWRLALTTRDPAVVERYLTRYPAGAHAADAGELARQLKEAETSLKEPGALCDHLATHPDDATASTPGVELDALAAHAPAAIDACERAQAAAPKSAHYKALLARAHWAARQYDEAVRLYRVAAEAGDARALWSLGRLEERGDHVPKDIAAAYGHYRQAAERGLGDAAVDVALALQQGKVLPKDTARAYELLKSAAGAGSAIAIFDLGKFAEDKLGGRPEDALPLYRRAAALGYPKGHRAAAVLLDEGLTVTRDPEAAAEELLRAAAADAGVVRDELTGPKQVWSPETVAVLQRRLKGAGYYAGATDGRSGPALAQALKRWRLGGDPRRAQSTK